MAKSGDLGKAVGLYQKVLSRAPDDPALHYELGRTYRAANQLQNALAHFNQAISLGDRSASLFVSTAELLTRLNRLAEAESMARAAIALEPGQLDGLRLLARILLPLGKFNEAKACGEQLIALSPDNPGDHVLLGWAFLSLEQFDNAIVLAKRAVALDANSSAAFYLMSRVYKNVQQWEKALTMAEKAVSLEPANSEYCAMRANMLEHLGRFDDAHEAVLPLIERAAPRNGLAVLVFARLAKRYGEQERAVRLLEEKIGDRATEVTMQHAALSLLGGLYDTLGEYDKAFLAIDRANKIRPSRYNLESMTNYMQGMSATFNEKYFRDVMPVARNNEKPIFIVGMPRSGTSLTEKILSRHPNIKACGETLHLPRALHEKLPELLQSDDSFPACMGGINQEIADQVAAHYLHEMGRSEGKRITEKRPMNFMYLGAIATLYPQAKIIHCTRDPLDIGLSCYFANFTSTSELSFSQDLELFADYYKQYEQMMTHWHKVLPIAMLEVSYEALVSDPETEIANLLEFCELSWYEGCLNPHESTQLTTTASYDQVRKPINTSSIGRWKRYEKQLEPLRVALGSAATSQAA